eukprot:TRINITY_DN8538_c0_g1_i4.p1 TRINITY_DN8538_c0_g1~~TRINITY_DN8538_c0_g1_i4.p1  ORF type:complete len:418 (+),score=81.11 TRINITY_DN8538_c0_g1_i4:301-1554(+)
MASLKPQTEPSVISQSTSTDSNAKLQQQQQPQNRKKKTKKKKGRSMKGFSPRISCFRAETVETPDGRQSLEMEAEIAGERRNPTHLVVFIHGIIGSPSDWRFAAKQFVKRFPEDVLVHCSKCNSSTLTFDGVDVMGERLAQEVISVIKHRPELQKISFVGHSLGGLIARYTIGRLYGQNITRETFEENGECRSVEPGAQCLEEKSKGKIAGLEPMNFITFATPHLGSIGHKQIPILCGFYALEKMASRTSWIVGRTGKHLFLKDHDEGNPPLLLQMINDCGDLKFMSALQCFRRRVVYSNARFDHIVGWKTSSIRRQHELPKRQHLHKNEKYPHIVNVETNKTAIQQEALLEGKFDRIDVEEAMIRGLNRVSWERVDVSFRKSRQRYFAHNTIQVNTYRINSDGADVIFHMIDNFLL